MRLPESNPVSVADFIGRSSASEGAERTNKDSYLSELCDLFGVARPDPTTGDPERDAYAFEKYVRRANAEGTLESVGRIDLYRKGAFVLEAKQAEHPDLTITEMYNVLEKLRSGEAPSAKERKIHDDGLVSVLRQIHDDVDAAVFDAYGWPKNLTDEEILERLVALNAERAEEEKRGLIRWLRPEYQNPAGSKPATQSALREISPEVDDGETKPKARRGKAKSKSLPTPKPPAKLLRWPATLPKQLAAVRQVFDSTNDSLTAEELAARFKETTRRDVEAVLEGLVSLGFVKRSGAGRGARYTAA